MQETKKVREMNELNNDMKTRKRSTVRTNLQWHKNKTMQLVEERNREQEHRKKQKKRKKV